MEGSSYRYVQSFLTLVDETDGQEFVDARRLQSLQSAPQVTYSNREPPLEIRNVPGLKNGEDWGYVTFS